MAKSVPKSANAASNFAGRVAVRVAPEWRDSHKTAAQGARFPHTDAALTGRPRWRKLPAFQGEPRQGAEKPLGPRDAGSAEILRT